MSEFWDQPAPDYDVSGPGDPYDPGVLPADVAGDPGGEAAIDPYVEAPPSIYEPMWEPAEVSCCDCATPGWEPVFSEQLEQTWAADPPAASVVLSQGAYDPNWSSWDAVAADPTAGGGHGGSAAGAGLSRGHGHVRGWRGDGPLDCLSDQLHGRADRG